MTEPATHRICLTLEYDGGSFLGWQVQPEGRTVQGEIERVLSRLLDAPVRVTGSGRTDRGVHAVGQVATVDAPVRWTADSLERAANALLPGDVRVLDARVVPARFHARYGAMRRSYVYRVGTDPVAGSPFHARWCWPLMERLDQELLKGAARALIGEHSFMAFAKAGQEERGDRCTVSTACWSEWPGLGIQFEVSANRFLHHMVRYLVGTMVDIGRRRRPLDDLQAMLAGDESLGTSPPAPPEGLFLYAVEYPEELWGDAGPPPAMEPQHLP